MSGAMLAEDEAGDKDIRDSFVGSVQVEGKTL
jgi:hypothetical protein